MVNCVRCLFFACWIPWGLAAAWVLAFTCWANGLIASSTPSEESPQPSRATGSRWQELPLKQIEPVDRQTSNRLLDETLTSVQRGN